MSAGRVPGPRSSSSANAASWSTSLVRYFLVDYDNGSDSNPGYIDAAAGSTLTGLSGIPIKTMERLYEIVPQLGNGRSMVVLQKPRAAGANYLDKDAVTQSNLDTSRWSGYRTFLWRGSTDHSNDTTDRVTCGFQVAITGPGGSGEFTCAAGASTTLVPIAAGTIGAEAATQYRIRFLATTTTAALRNICRPITSMVANTSVTCGNALPATPAAGDVFVIEQPGVRIAQVIFDSRNQGTVTPTTPTPQLVGIAATATASSSFIVSGPRLVMSGIEMTGSTTNFAFLVNFAGFVQIADFYTDEANTLRTIGMGLRIQCSGSWQPLNTLNAQCIGCMNTAATQNINAPPTGGCGDRSYFGGIINLRGSGVEGIRQSPGTLASQFLFGGPSTSSAMTRVVSGGNVTPFAIFANPANIWRLNFENFAAATHGAIYIKDCVGGAMNIEGCTSDGSPIYGLDISGTHGVTFKFGNTIANTVTGTTAELLLGGNATATWADFTKVGFRDPQGNVLMGTAGLTSGETIVVTNAQGGAVAMAPGELVFISAASSVQKSNAAAGATAKIDGVMVTTTADTKLGLMSPPTGAPYVLTQAAPAAAAQMNLSAVTAGTATSAVPAIVVAVGRAIDADGVKTAIRISLNSR